MATAFLGLLAKNECVLIMSADKTIIQYLSIPALVVPSQRLQTFFR